ncbi:MAG: type II toxin-antitoxin system mRNA interferase toxin, RelE/StbE family [Gammaproteobacteria bacterium]|nr:type II toxin-antitoxin system mRNA interferase toxin, RelE/StbE family [Gammaproteobacteria bacterium]
MWGVYEHRRVDKQLKKLPEDVLKRYEKWKDIVELSGPVGLRKIRGFRDEALGGDWKGYRSSRLNQQYRVIYRVESDRLIVQVLEVNPHDYRRKGQ